MKIFEMIAKLLTKSAGFELPSEMKITEEDRRRFRKEKNDSNVIVDSSYMI